MNERFQKLIRISVTLRETLSYDLTDRTRDELQGKLDLVTAEISNILRENPVIK